MMEWEAEEFKFLQKIINFWYTILRKEPTKQERLWDYPHIPITDKLDFQEPEFTVEFIYTECFNVYQRKDFVQLTELLRAHMKSEYFFMSPEISVLNAFWRRLTSLGSPYNSPEKVMTRIEFAMTLCRKSNLFDLIEPLQSLGENLKATIKPLTTLRNKAKKETLQKLFKILSEEYIVKKRKKISMNYEHLRIKEEDDYFDLFYSKIQNLIWYYNQLYELRIFLPSKDVADEIERYFHGFRKHDRNKLFNLLLFERTSETTFSIKNEAFYLFIDKVSIEENLIDILENFIGILEKNHSKLIIQTETTKDKKFFKFFQLYLQKELDNSYFEFQFENPSDNMKEVSLLIIRKPPKKKLNKHLN